MTRNRPVSKVSLTTLARAKRDALMVAQQRFSTLGKANVFKTTRQTAGNVFYRFGSFMSAWIHKVRGARFKQVRSPIASMGAARMELFRLNLGGLHF